MKENVSGWLGYLFCLPRCSASAGILCDCRVLEVGWLPGLV